jgi:hypothetical protein
MCSPMGSPRSFLEITVRPSGTLRQAQGERVGPCLRWVFTVRAEPVKARFCQLQSRLAVSQSLSVRRARQGKEEGAPFRSRSGPLPPRPRGPPETSLSIEGLLNFF